MNYDLNILTSPSAKCDVYVCLVMFRGWMGGGGLRDVRIAEGAFSLPFDEQCIVLWILCMSINKKERRKILILKTRDQLLAKPSS